MPAVRDGRMFKTCAAATGALHAELQRMEPSAQEAALEPVMSVLLVFMSAMNLLGQLSMAQQLSCAVTINAGWEQAPEAALVPALARVRTSHLSKQLICRLARCRCRQLPAAHLNLHSFHLRFHPDAHFFRKHGMKL